MNTLTLLHGGDAGRRISFRFGLTGTRWGEEGPAVLLVHGEPERPVLLRRLIGPLVASGYQVIELDDPGSGVSADEASTPAALALAIAEAAVEIRNLDAVVGHGPGAAATLLALGEGLPAQRAVLVAPPLTNEAGRFRSPPTPVLTVVSPDHAGATEQVIAFLTGRSEAWRQAQLMPAAA